ncbi:glycosyltransferase family 39 protein [Sinomonas sp. JGH33]|uniref:Glycosyltransferase family 39 protein n=1 Tax=Sinomonas terricola TaxID=3110330 RepID=A0ABU5T178_9MICC|nr:glycosyltransferase family 39 protein [Sinomonas sp. JGH33]MEA5453418.1 glycosyltransferase family 39 protein [Sinomonas sp. JGH33]
MGLQGADDDGAGLGRSGRRNEQGLGGMSAVAAAEAGLRRRRGAGVSAALGTWARSSTVHRVFLALLSGALYLPGLDQNGWANAYYSAAVQAAAKSWTSFWFASADMGNFLSVDKPPLGIWVMALSARVFGFNVWSMLVPQALMGICTVLLVYAICRTFLPSAYALFAGAATATTPVATVMFRYNNPDALLVLLMTVGAWATLRAVRRPSLAWSLVIGASIGLGFMTKQLQVLLIAPAVAVCLLGTRRTSWHQKLRQAAIAVATALATGLTWFVAVSLVPTGSRPFIGGSRTNSIWDLTLGYNGLDRLTGLDASRTGPATEGTDPASGFIRFIYPNYAGQISWLLPLAVVATVFVLFLAMRRRLGSVPLPVTFACLWWWTSVPVLAYMGGIIHPYYSLVLVSPTAMLAAWALRIGLHRSARRWTRRTLAIGILATMLMNLIIIGLYTRGYAFLADAIVLMGAVACAGLVLSRTPPLIIARVIAGLTAAALMTGPLVWSAVTASSGHVGSAPNAGPPGVIGVTDSPDHRGLLPSMTPPSESIMLGVTPNAELAGRIDSATTQTGWNAAAVGGQNAALATLATGVPVLPLGGFDGSDPTPTLEQFQQLVVQGRVGGLVLGTLPLGAQNGSESQRIVDWVQKTYSSSAYGSLTFYSFGETR